MLDGLARLCRELAWPPARADRALACHRHFTRVDRCRPEPGRERDRRDRLAPVPHQRGPRLCGAPSIVGTVGRSTRRADLRARRDRGAIRTFVAAARGHPGYGEEPGTHGGWT